MDKRAKLLALADLRKQSRWTGYNCIGDYYGGAYECDFVSPYTKVAGNLDAWLFVMLQDWSSDDTLGRGLNKERARLGYSPELPTNLNLIRLLKSTFKMQLSDVYGTNLFPFIKYGPKNAAIPQKDLIRAAREFGLPQIQIVAPRLVVCLGLKTFNALRRVCNLSPAKNLESALGLPFEYESSQIWCQAHTGRLGQINRNKGGVDRVSTDWQRMKGVLKENLHAAVQL